MPDVPARGPMPCACCRAREARKADRRKTAGKRCVVHWKQCAHLPELFPFGPIGGGIPAFQADAHRDHPDLRRAVIDEQDVVNRALGRQWIDGHPELFRQNFCEFVAINVIDATRRSRHQRERFRPIGAGGRDAG